MNHSKACTLLVIDFEGFSLVSYQDGNGIWNLGVGHTKGVGPNQTCSLEQATSWLTEDLQDADDVVARLVTVPLKQNQWDALVALVFNVKQGSFLSSTCRRLLNAGDYKGAADAILLMDKVGGEPSLTRRRTAERALFLGENT